MGGSAGMGGVCTMADPPEFLHMSLIACTIVSLDGPWALGGASGGVRNPECGEAPSLQRFRDLSSELQVW
eukprot:820018-Pyramimonas_sp.AAC.2